VPPEKESNYNVDPGGQKGKAEEKLPGENTEPSSHPEHSCHRTCSRLTRELTVTA